MLYSSTAVITDMHTYKAKLTRDWEDMKMNVCTTGNMVLWHIPKCVPCLASSNQVQLSEETNLLGQASVVCRQIDYLSGLVGFVRSGIKQQL